jgi:hypothetical protein
MTSATRRPVAAPAGGEAGEGASVFVGADVEVGAVRGVSASDSSDKRTLAVAWLALLPVSEATPCSVAA